MNSGGFLLSVKAAGPSPFETVKGDVQPVTRILTVINLEVKLIPLGFGSAPSSRFTY